METFKGCLQYLLAGAILLGVGYLGIARWASHDEAKKTKAREEKLASTLSTESGYLKKRVDASLKPKVPMQGGAVILTGIIRNNGDRDLVHATVKLTLLKAPKQEITRNFGPIKAGKIYEISEELPETKTRTHHMGESYDIKVTGIKFK